MIRLFYAVALAFLGAVMAASGFDAAADDALIDTRYCGVENIKRDPDGKISRRSDVLREFRRLYACPSTKKHTGACPGWNIDHPIPLARGGCDAVSNLQWLPVQTKRCGVWYCKDRWELWVYQRAPAR